MLWNIFARPLHIGEFSLIAMLNIELCVNLVSLCCQLKNWWQTQQDAVTAWPYSFIRMCA